MPFTCDPRVSKGEYCCLAGPCIEMPCIDNQAPNRSFRCCVLPKYDDEFIPFEEWFEDILPSVHTGDVVLASWPSESDPGTGISRCMAHTRWSHVGLIYRPSDCPDVLKHKDLVFDDEIHASRPLMLHMIAGGESGHRIRREKGGMDIIDFEVYAKDYFDKFSHNGPALNPTASQPHLIAIRRLTNIERTEQWYRHFEAIVDKYDDTIFNEAMDWNTMSAQIDCCQSLLYPGCCWRAAEKPQNGLLCSVLMAEIYKGVGLLETEMESAEYIPAMWDTTRKLQMLGGARFSQEYFTVGPITAEERETVMGYPPLAAEALGGKQGLGQQISVPHGSGGFWGVDVTQPISVINSSMNIRPTMAFFDRKAYSGVHEAQTPAKRPEQVSMIEENKSSLELSDIKTPLQNQGS